MLNQVKKENVASFKSRTAKSIHIQEGAGDIKDYDILGINEFTSERKIMSVMVQDKQTGKYYVFAKGAESKIMEKLTPESAQSALKKRIEESVFSFGGQGLRTLVFAMREMS